MLATLERRPSRAQLVLLSDFDGTLTPFTVDPSKSRLSEETRQALEALSSRDDVTVGLVSGRRVDDLEHCTALPPQIYLAGLHGLEIRREGRAWHHPDLVESRDMIDAVVAQMDAAVGHVDGVRLEHKGVALTVHVRGVATLSKQAVLEEADLVAQPWLESGALRAMDAKEAFELLPNIPWNKGDAVQWIVEDIESRVGRPTWCVFFGDDVTDEDAFEATGTDLSVVVGRRPSAAQLRLDSPADVAAVLTGVNPPHRARVRGENPGNPRARVRDAGPGSGGGR
ncbi:MAG TPA: trehalose-phosphatase [Vicinamibacterales bacterium]